MVGTLDTLLQDVLSSPSSQIGLQLLSGQDFATAAAKGSQVARETGQRAKQEQQRKVLSEAVNILSQKGVDLTSPEFAPNFAKTAQGLNIDPLVTAEFLKSVAPLSKGKERTPLSPTGKLLADIEAAGQGVGGDILTQRLQKLISPDAPVFETELSKKRAAGRAKFETSLDEAADRGLASLDSIPFLRESLAKSFSGGPLDELAILGSGFAQQLGFDIDSEKLANTETFRSESRKLITPFIKALGSNPSNSDREFIISSFAGIGKSREANEKLLNVQEAIALKAVARRNFKDGILGLPSSEFTKEMQKFDRENPLKGFFDEVKSSNVATKQPNIGLRQTLAPITQNIQQNIQKLRTIGATEQEIEQFLRQKGLR